MHNSAAGVGSGGARRPALLAVLLALTLSCLAPATAVAQQDPLDLGSQDSIRLNFIAPVTVGDKVYYYLAHGGGATANFSTDRLDHDELDTLFNGGMDTTNDARTITVNGYDIILPTLTEMQALRADQVANGRTNGVPEGWWVNSYYNTATAGALPETHKRIHLSLNLNNDRTDISDFSTAVQIIAPPDPVGFGTATIENQSYVIGETVDLTLPEATGGMTPYSYTLLRNNAIVPPATGLTFDPNNRTLKGIAAAVFAEGTKPAAVLVYTVTDSSSPTASAALTFTARINAAPAAPAVSLVLTPAIISENGGVSTFTATLNPATSGITTVTITATPDTGTATGDFSLSGNTLTFADSATTSTGTVTLAANDNNVYTGDKTITISATVNNGVTAPANVTLTISEDEAAPIPVVTLLLTPLSIAEGGVATVTATINPASTGATMVTVAAAPTTGATADDFTLSPNTTLTFADGATASTGTVTITAATNNVDSPDKTITVSASADNTATVPTTVSLTITDDDDTPTVTLELAATSINEGGSGTSTTVSAILDRASSEDTVVTITAPSGGNANDYTLSAAPTLTIAAGDTTTTDTVTITATDNSVDAGSNKVSMVSATASNSHGINNPTAVSLTIIEDEGVSPNDPPRAQTVPADFALKPAAVAAGGSFRLLYLTTATTTATSPDIGTYNLHVQTSAAGGHSAIQPFASQFRALVSTSAMDARDNTATNLNKASPDTDVAIYWLNGDLVASGANQLYAGTGWSSRTPTNEAGNAHTFSTMWTGSNADGRKHSDGFMGSAGTVVYGSLGALTAGEEINSSERAAGTVPQPIYALSPVLILTRAPTVDNAIPDQTVPANFALKPAAVAAGGSFRLLYLTTATTTATSPDIGTYNLHVQTSAAGGHSAIQPFASQFRALVSTSAMDARDNTATNLNKASPDTDVAIYWLNGDLVASGANQLYAGTGWSSRTPTNEAGNAHTFSTMWTGSNADGRKHSDGFMGSAGTVVYGFLGALAAGEEINSSERAAGTVLQPIYALSPVLILTRAPTVATAIPDQSGSAGTALTYTFPDTTFTDGDSDDTLAYSFEVTPAAAWLSFNADTRTFSGMPPATGLPTDGIFTITVTASDGTNSVTDEFTLTIAPALGLDATIDDQIYTATQVINFTLPEATGGTATYNYALTPTANLPGGLSFTAGTRTIGGSPSAAAPAATLTYTVTDSAATPSTFVATFDITVNAAPTITFSAADDQTYTVGVEITPLLLPEAVGGTAPLTYRAVATPPGLTFSAANRNLIGTPTEVHAGFGFSFQATDANGISSDVTSRFVIIINKGTQAALTFAVTNVDATFGGAVFTQAATGGSGSGALTYESSDTAVATVDANGEVTIVGGGTTTITATKEADDNYLAATATYTVTVAKAAQAAFSAGADQTMTFVANATFTQTATGGSGTGGVEYESDDTAVATVNSTSGEVTLVGAGSATITARKAADDDYLEASDTYLLTISKGTQVGFSAGTDRNANVGDAAITQAATGGSGNGAVTYESSDAAVATVVSGGVVSIVGVGTATITATKEADANYLVATDTYMLTVGKGTQAAFSAGGDRTETFVAGATFTQEASGGSGTGAVTYESSDAAVATVAGGGVVTLVGVGTATITATKEADANYLVATDTYMLTVEKGPQVNFDAGSNRTETFVANATFTQAATGGSGTGAVTYESDDTAVATVASGGVVTLVAVGSATITATKAADANYNIATDSYILTVTDPSKTDQTGFSAGADQTMTFVAGATFTQAATGGESGGTINYASSNTDVATVATGGVVTLVGAGMTSITATRAGNATYNDITDSYDLTVSKGTQVAFSAGADQTMTFVANATFTQAATGGSGSGAVTYMSSDTAVATVAGGGVVTIIAGGTTTITATKDEDDDYLAATDSYILTVGKAAQVGFSAGADQTMTFVAGATFTQAATGGSGGGAVTYMSSDTAVATVASGGVVSIVGAGTATITAEKAADADYNVATDTYMLTVNKGTQVSINAGADRAVSVGDTFTQVATGGSGTGALTYASSDTAIATVDNNGLVTIISVGTGTATITATKAEDDDYLEATDTYMLTVSKGAQTGFSAGADRTERIGGANFIQEASGGSGTGDVTYASNNDLVATVDSATGEVTIVAAGTATITATKEADDDYLVATDSYELTVNAKTNQAALSAGADRTETFVANATFTQAATGGSGTGAVTYASSNTAVATVASGGVVTLVSVGTTTITATKDGDATYNEIVDSYILTVSDPAKTDQAAFSAGADRTETFAVGATFTQAATGGSGTGAVTYASSNTAVATVASGGVVTLVAVGTATITATKDGDATYNEIVDSYILTVSDPAKTDQAAFSVGADRTETFVANATFTQAATGGSGTGAVTYTSSNTAVATVASGGVVTLVSAGTTTITATKDGDATYNAATDSYILTVNKVAQVGFSAGDDQTLTFVANATFTQAATGGSGTGPVTYVSSNTAVATVASGGVVTLVAVGTATITATKAGDATYNEATATFNVTVVRAVSISEPNNEIDINLNLDTADTGDVVNEGILTLPSGHGVSTVTLGVIQQDAVDSQPTGVEFALTIDIALNVPLPVNEIATVCLPTTGVPAGRTPVLYHYTSGAWNEIGREITTRGSIDYVCGETMTFSPFGVGYVAEATAVNLHEQILSRVSQTVTAGTLAAVGARVDAAARAASAGVSANAAAPTLAYQLGGQSSMRDLLQAHGKSMLEGEIEVERLLDGASFVIPLSAAGDQSAGHAFGALSVWGGIDYRNLSSDEGGLDWDGGVSSFHFGIDGLVGDTVLAGVALSGHRADFDYESTVDAATGTGEYQYHSTNINPYLGWFPSKNVKLWASAGFGSGEVVLDEVVNEEETGGKYVTDTSQSSFTGGFSARLLRANSLTLYIKGDATQSKVELDEAEGIMQQEVNSRRTRLLLSGEQRRELASGGVMMPSLEVGGRSDSGDGVTGTGVELGGGLRYTNPSGSLVVSGNVRALLAHDYDEWGADLNVRILPPSGRGLSLSVNPVWGKAQSAAERLWDDGANGVVGDSGDGELQSSLAAEVGYGVGATMLGSAGLLTPYLGMSADEVGVGRVRLGGRFAGGNGLSMNLEGTQRDTVDGVNHMVLLRGELAF